MHYEVENWKQQVSQLILRRMKKHDKNRDGFLTREEMFGLTPKHNEEL